MNTDSFVAWLTTQDSNTCNCILSSVNSSGIMSELDEFQRQYWEPFTQLLVRRNSALQNPQFNGRNLKFHNFGPSRWLETIVNFGHPSRNDESVAVSLVMLSADPMSYRLEFTLRDVIEIEGSEFDMRRWSDDSVEGRRTIKLSRRADGLRRRAANWDEQLEWHFTMLHRFKSVLERRIPT